MSPHAVAGGWGGGGDWGNILNATCNGDALHFHLHICHDDTDDNFCYTSVNTHITSFNDDTDENFGYTSVKITFLFSQV